MYMERAIAIFFLIFGAALTVWATSALGLESMRVEYIALVGGVASMATAISVLDKRE